MINKPYEEITFRIIKFDKEDILSSSGDNGGYVIPGDGTGGDINLPNIMI